MASKTRSRGAIKTADTLAHLEKLIEITNSVPNCVNTKFGFRSQEYSLFVATIEELKAMGFASSEVIPKKLNIDHPDPHGVGPFCRLNVTTLAPERAGVYAWVVGLKVYYVGKASYLVHVVKGMKYGRAYNDYTYVPKSQASQASDTRVRINGLLNKAIAEGSTVTWWWLETGTLVAATQKESQLIDKWEPSWNIAKPQGRTAKSEI